MGKRSKADAKVGAGGRKRLADVVASLEKARAKRDRAQARVDALEAIAEELASRMASEATSASEERGKEAAAVGHEPEEPSSVAPDPKAAAKPKPASGPKAADGTAD